MKKYNSLDGKIHTDSLLLFRVRMNLKELIKKIKALGGNLNRKRYKMAKIMIDVADGDHCGKCTMLEAISEGVKETIHACLQFKRLLNTEQVKGGLREIACKCNECKEESENIANHMQEGVNWCEVRRLLKLQLDKDTEVPVCDEIKKVLEREPDIVEKVCEKFCPRKEHCKDMENYTPEEMKILNEPHGSD